MAVLRTRYCLLIVCIALMIGHAWAKGLSERHRRYANSREETEREWNKQLEREMSYVDHHHRDKRAHDAPGPDDDEGPGYRRRRRGSAEEAAFAAELDNDPLDGDPEPDWMQRRKKK